MHDDVVGVGSSLRGSTFTVATGGADVAVLGGLAFGAGDLATAIGVGGASVSSAIVVGDAAAIGLSTPAAVTDCATKGFWSASCGFDAASLALGGTRLWGDWGFAPKWWGAGLGSSSVVTCTGGLLYGQFARGSSEPRQCGP